MSGDRSPDRVGVDAVRAGGWRALAPLVGNVLTDVVENSGTSNVAALRRLQKLRPGLTSIGATQVFLTPRMEFGGRSRGFGDFRRSVVLRPVVALGEGGWCFLETIGDIPSCKEYTSKYRKMATETLRRKRLQQHEQ